MQYGNCRRPRREKPFFPRSLTLAIRIHHGLFVLPFSFSFFSAIRDFFFLYLFIFIIHSPCRSFALRVGQSLVPAPFLPPARFIILHRCGGEPGFSVHLSTRGSPEPARLAGIIFPRCAARVFLCISLFSLSCLSFFPFVYFVVFFIWSDGRVSRATGPRVRFHLCPNKPIEQPVMPFSVCLFLHVSFLLLFSPSFLFSFPMPLCSQHAVTIILRRSIVVTSILFFPHFFFFRFSYQSTLRCSLPFALVSSLYRAPLVGIPTPTPPQRGVSVNSLTSTQR